MTVPVLQHPDDEFVKVAEPVLIVRAWPSDNSLPPVDEEHHLLVDAISRAWALAADREKKYRTVIVTDLSSTMWAQFNMLWYAIEWEEKYLPERYR